MVPKTLGEKVKMSLALPEKKIFDAQNDLTPIPLLANSLRIPVEQLVSEYIGKSWVVKLFRDMNDFSSHPSAIFSDGEYSVFVKLSQAANGLEQFETELAGLRYLSELAGVLTPTSIGNVEVESGVIMVLGAVETVDRTPLQWRQIGQTLARIHCIKGQHFGLDSHNYF